MRPVAILVVLVAAATATAADRPAPGAGTLAVAGSGPGLEVAVAAVDRTVRAAGSGLGRGPVSAARSGRADAPAAGVASSTLGVLIVDGGAHRCSAAVVTSTSRRLLATAGHCVWLQGRWTLEDAYFVPGYRDGNEPWGRWAVEAAWVPQSWQDANSPAENVASAHDVAFARLAPNQDGELAEDVLGSQGIWFDPPSAPAVTALGYPATGAYDGEQIERCTGRAHVEGMAAARDESDGAPRSGGEVMVLDCDMTGGASGGPWLVGPRSEDGSGHVIGVVSAGSGPQLLSAWYGPEAEQVYQAADTGSGLSESRPDESRPGERDLR